LHQETLNKNLECFVLYSSISSFLGYAGQSNYAAANSLLESLALYRKSLGLRVTCVSWGPWADVGMAASLNEISRRTMKRQGVGDIPIEAGLNALERAIHSKKSNLGALSIQWPQYGEGNGPAEALGFFSQ